MLEGFPEEIGWLVAAMTLGNGRCSRNYIAAWVDGRCEWGGVGGNAFGAGGYWNGDGQGMGSELQEWGEVVSRWPCRCSLPAGEGGKGGGREGGRKRRREGGKEEGREEGRNSSFVLTIPQSLETVSNKCTMQ